MSWRSSAATGPALTYHSRPAAQGGRRAEEGTSPEARGHLRTPATAARALHGTSRGGGARAWESGWRPLVPWRAPPLVSPECRRPTDGRGRGGPSGRRLRAALRGGAEAGESGPAPTTRRSGSRGAQGRVTGRPSRKGGRGRPGRSSPVGSSRLVSARTSSTPAPLTISTARPVGPPFGNGLQGGLKRRARDPRPERGH